MSMFSPINPKKLRHSRAAGMNQSISLLREIHDMLEELQGVVDHLLPGLSSSSAGASGQRVSVGHVSMTVETYIFMAREDMRSAQRNLEFAKQEASTDDSAAAAATGQDVDEETQLGSPTTPTRPVPRQAPIQRGGDIENGALLPPTTPPNCRPRAHDSSPPFSSEVSIAEEDTTTLLHSPSSSSPPPSYSPLAHKSSPLLSSQASTAEEHATAPRGPAPHHCRDNECTYVGTDTTAVSVPSVPESGRQSPT